MTQDFRLRVNKAIHTLQLSFDVLNIGNLLKSSWGVTQTTAPCNYGKILRYEGTDAAGVPTYSMGYNTVNKKKELYTRTYEPFAPFLTAAVIYLAITLCIVGIFRRIEKRLNRHL